MLDTKRLYPPERIPERLPGTESREVAEILLGVLKSIEPYEACIAEAERDGDYEVAAFLRELRRQDLDRAKEATRLLKRPFKSTSVEERGESHVELSVGS